MNENKTFEKLNLLYQENAKIAAIFWEWRNKILTYFFTAIGALFALAAWLYQQQLSRYITSALLLGVVLAIVSLFLDYRNEDILKKCYQVGGDIEIELRKEIDVIKGKTAIFEFLGEAHRERRRITYTATLRATYIIVGILLFVLSILNCIFPLEKSA